jgi:hypothetical protein
MRTKQGIIDSRTCLSPRMVNNISPKSATGSGFMRLARGAWRNASNFIESTNGIGTGDRLGVPRDRERDTMITRLLVALFALYLVAGSPNPRDLPVASLLSAPKPNEGGQVELAKQVVDFCLAHRETCASIASGLIPAPARTGAIAATPKPFEAQNLPEPAPELPLPPRRRASIQSGA